MDGLQKESIVDAIQKLNSSNADSRNLGMNITTLISKGYDKLLDILNNIKSIDSLLTSDNPYYIYVEINKEHPYFNIGTFDGLYNRGDDRIVFKNIDPTLYQETYPSGETQMTIKMGETPDATKIFLLGEYRIYLLSNYITELLKYPELIHNNNYHLSLLHNISVIV